MARKNDGACGNPKLIRTDVDCRAARPKFNEGAWSPAKISDVTGGGLYLFATPDESRPDNAASKLWRMPHYRATRSTSACGCLALIPRLIIAPRTLRQGMAMSSSSSYRISIIRLWKGSTRSMDRSR
jgi:hypothetical protein